jgi:hypothetical protein
VTLVESIYEGWEIAITSLIDSEVQIRIHIVNIRPHYIKWDAVVRVTLDDCFQSCSILVAIATLIPTQEPFGNEHRLTDNVLVALGQLYRSFSFINEEVDRATSRENVQSDLSCQFVVLHNNILRSSIVEEERGKRVLICFELEVRMVSVGVSTW